jgi:hypothetical protein
MPLQTRDATAKNRRNAARVVKDMTNDQDTSIEEAIAKGRQKIKSANKRKAHTYTVDNVDDAIIGHMIDKKKWPHLEDPIEHSTLATRKKNREQRVFGNIDTALHGKIVRGTTIPSLGKYIRQRQLILEQKMQPHILAGRITEKELKQIWDYEPRKKKQVFTTESIDDALAGDIRRNKKLSKRKTLIKDGTLANGERTIYSIGRALRSKNVPDTTARNRHDYLVEREDILREKIFCGEEFTQEEIEKIDEVFKNAKDKSLFLKNKNQRIERAYQSTKKNKKEQDKSKKLSLKQKLEEEIQKQALARRLDTYFDEDNSSADRNLDSLQYFIS